MNYELYNGTGKIIEYDNYYDNLIFEGEYLNGEKIGIIKEYHYNGKLKSECEYSNGKKNGKSK